MIALALKIGGALAFALIAWYWPKAHIVAMKDAMQNLAKKRQQ